MLLFRSEVSDDLNEAYNWYESQQSGLGDNFLDCVNETLARISQMPDSYAIFYRDVRRAVVKRFPYAVYYRVRENRQIVLAISHGRRDSKQWQMRT